MKKNEQGPRAPIDSLVIDAENANQGDQAAVAASLREFGQLTPVVVQSGTRRIAKGNHTVRAAQALGWTEVWIHEVEMDDATLRRYAIADNATGRRARWDVPVLAEQLVALEVAELPGLPEHEVTQIMGIAAKTETRTPSQAADKVALRLTRGKAIAKCLVAIDDVGTFERALRATGQNNRGEALLTVCKAYLAQEAGRGN